MTDSKVANKKQRQKYKELKNSHLCVVCRGQDANTLAGHTRCFECSRKAAERMRKLYLTDENYSRKMREHQTKIYNQKKANKVCVRCGAPLPGGEYSFVRCPECTSKEKRMRMKGAAEV